MSRAIRMLVAATAAGGLALSGLMTAGAASAGVTGAGTHGPSFRYFAPGTGSHAAGPVTAAVTNSRTFAGYQTAVTAGSATSSAASFTVPTLSCTTATRAISPDAGVAVNNYKSSSVAFVIIGCMNGKALDFPGVIINGTETDYTNTPVSAGDVINLSTSVTTSGTTAQVTDVTTGVTNTLSGAGASASAAWIGDDPAASSTTSLLHVPNFGKLTFKSCLIDGKALAGWHPQAYQRVNSLGTVQIATGAFWPGGTAFTTHYQHS